MNVSKLLIFTVLFMISCGSSKSTKKQISQTDSIQMTGSDRDSMGCIGSAGYVWSTLKQDCIRPWEVGVMLNPVGDTTIAAYVIFSDDSLKVELFLPNTQEKDILERRTLPKGGGYAWNVEDDDTKNLTLLNGIWSISQRGKVIFEQRY